jgi:N-acyl-D-amino-acid deacylase
MEKTVLKNCKILDGTGNPWYKGDIALEKEKIVKISTSGIRFNREDNVIDVKGDVVCPGFIDIHTHSDTPFLKDKYAYSKICQGITTEVVGNCGISCAPLVGEGGKTFRNMRSSFFGNIEMNWETMQEYLDQLEKNKLPQNVAPLVGHSTIRACVLGCMCFRIC